MVVPLRRPVSGPGCISTTVGGLLHCGFVYKVGANFGIVFRFFLPRKRSFVCCCSIDWLIGSFVYLAFALASTGWLIDWLIDSSFIQRSVHRSIDWLISLFVPRLVLWLIDWLAYLSESFNRNNLTVVESIPIRGCGVEPKIKFSNDATVPGTDTLTMKFTGKDGAYCRNRTFYFIEKCWLVFFSAGLEPFLLRGLFSW